MIIPRSDARAINAFTDIIAHCQELLFPLIVKSLSVLWLLMDVVSSYLKDSIIIIQGKENREGSWDMGQM